MGFGKFLKVTAYLLAGVLVCAGSDVLAQDLFEDEQAASDSELEWFGDMQLRYDNVDFPTPRELERGKGRVRAGFRYLSDSIEFVVAAKLNGGTDDNSDNIRNLDNEVSNDFNLAQLYVSWWANAQTEVRAGKSEFQAVLTPMVWDRDIAPAGLSLQSRKSVREFDEIEWLVGYYSGEHEFDSKPNLGIAQVGWLIQPGAPQWGEITASYLAFDSLNTVSASGIGRTNSQAGGFLTEDYRMLDLQMAYHWRSGQFPWVARLDLIHNFGADDENDGVRAELIGGNAPAGGWEVGVAWQRVQRDAVLAAFNEDDWWFPSRMRGVMPWVSYGFQEGLWLRGAVFIERRDDQPESLERILVDLNWEF